MKRIAAQLTPLLTCPAFLPWHLIGAAMCIPALLYVWISADPEVGGYVAAFILPAWSACVLTSLQKDLLHKPFSFTLPGHREALRRTMFGVGIAASLVASLGVLTFPGLSGLSQFWAVWSAFCFGLIVYLVIMGLQLLMDSATTALGPLIIVGAALIEFTGGRVLLQEAAIFAPVWNTCVLAAVSFLAWRSLGSQELARRTCGRRFLSLQMAWRRSAGEQFWLSGRREVLSKGTWRGRSWLLQQLFARISRRPALSLRRHLAAVQYEVAGYLAPSRPWTAPLIAMFVLVLVVVAGYIPPREGGAPAANALYVASCIVGLHLGVPMFTTMLLPAGRRERFWTALAMVGCGGLVVLATSLLLFILLQGMGTLAPPLSLGGKVYYFRPADLGLSFIPLVHLPLSMVLKVTCKKWLVAPEILLMSIACIGIVRAGIPLRDLNPYAIIAFLSVSWAILVGVLYTYSFHRDLVRE